MPLHEMWVHGNSATAEFGTNNRGPELDIAGNGWTAVVGYRTRTGVKYRCQKDTNYWFHFAIPTPVVINDARTFLRKVMVSYTSDQEVSLMKISVMVGTNEVFTVPMSRGASLSPGGDNIRLIEGRNSFDIPPDEERGRAALAVGVSAQFHFGEVGNVTLHGAGVIFES